jgi:hypothetical protein
MAGWQFWIDRGGSFTDIVARNPAARLSPRMPATESPGRRWVEREGGRTGRLTRSGDAHPAAAAASGPETSGGGRGAP